MRSVCLSASMHVNLTQQKLDVIGKLKKHSNLKPMGCPEHCSPCLKTRGSTKKLPAQLQPPFSHHHKNNNPGVTKGFNLQLPCKVQAGEEGWVLAWSKAPSPSAGLGYFLAQRHELFMLLIISTHKNQNSNVGHNLNITPC